MRHTFPCLTDWTQQTPFDAHYFYQAVWATRRVVESSPRQHVDIGSDILFVGTLTAHVPVTFVDIRPLEAELSGLTFIVGDLEQLPFPDRSVSSLSCLHVAEHVGLGRYGDRLDPRGTQQACRELSRILAPGGNLFFSVPVGAPRVLFNAHRIHSPLQVLDYFRDLELVELAAVGDDRRLHPDPDIDHLADLDYGCGLFWFRRAPDTRPRDWSERIGTDEASA